MNIPTKEELIAKKKREEFSDLEYKSNLKSISFEELLYLKVKYDKDFIKYWTVEERDFPKFQPVSIKVIVERLRNKGSYLNIEV